MVPGIDSLRKAKKNCHPEFFVLEEGDMAYCRINEILKHQMNRILNEDQEVSTMVKHLKETSGNNTLEISGTYKVGLDGTSTPTVQQGGQMLGKDGTVISSVMVMLKAFSSSSPATSYFLIILSMSKALLCRKREE